MIDLSIILIVVMGGVGGVVGYFSRIVKKYEDRRDNIYFKNLPSLYSNTFAFEDSFETFLKDSPLDQFMHKFSTIHSNLKTQIFSGEIFLFKSDLQEKLLKFYKNIENLDMLLNEIQKESEIKKNETVSLLRYSYNKNESFEHGISIKPKEILDEVKEINQVLKNELKRYKSYSLKLMILIFLLGFAVAMMEILKK